MNTLQQPECPRTEQLSALLDNEIAGRPGEEIAAHAATCPLCGAMLEDLTQQRTLLRSLAGASAGIDLAPLVDRRLAPGRRPAEVGQARWWHGWRLVPTGLATGGVLAAGIYFGVLLTGGAGIAATRPLAMAAFDPVPPGGICVGFQSCNTRGK